MGGSMAEYAKHDLASKPRPTFNLTAYRTLNEWHKNVRKEAFDFTKEQVERTPWGEDFEPRESLAVTTASFILGQGPDHTKRRIREMFLELVHLRTWVMYFRDQADKNPTSRYDARQTYEKVMQFERLLDTLRYLRSKYSITQPPSVPAPSATETEIGSPVISAKRVGKRKNVIDD